jgi:hypothetical protein
MKSKTRLCLALVLSGALIGCSSAIRSPEALPGVETSGKVQSVAQGGTAIPRVELNFSSMKAGDWQAEPFREIIRPDEVKRIVRVRESGFARGSDIGGEQADYEIFFAQIFGSDEKAKEWVLADNEATLAELVILTKTGALFRIEIIGYPAMPNVPTAILIYGSGRSARIEMKDFKYPHSAETGLPKNKALAWGETVGDLQMACSVDVANGVIHCWVGNAEEKAVTYNDFVFGYVENVALEIRQGTNWERVHAGVFPGDNGARGAIPTDTKIRWLPPGQTITETWNRRDAEVRRPYRDVGRRERLLVGICEGDTFALDLADARWWPTNILQSGTVEARVRQSFRSPLPGEEYPFVDGPSLNLFSPVFKLDAAALSAGGSKIVE